MKLVHRKDLIITKKIKHSLISPIIGSICIGSWGVGVYFMLEKKFPVFILVIQFFFWLIFIFILIKQWVGVFKEKNFFIAFNESDIILPLNYSIKNPEPDHDYYLQLDLAKDVTHFEVVQENRVFEVLDQNQHTTHYKNLIFLSFQLKDKISDHIAQKHTSVVNAYGFSGSPLILHDQKIEYSIVGNVRSLKKVEDIFKKMGIYSGKRLKRSVNLTKELSFEKIKENLILLSQLGDSFYNDNTLDYLIKNKMITTDQLKELRSDPQIKSLKK